jgi:hypothetical protein
MVFSTSRALIICGGKVGLCAPGVCLVLFHIRLKSALSAKV